MLLSAVPGAVLAGGTVGGPDVDNGDGGVDDIADGDGGLRRVGLGRVVAGQVEIESNV